MDSVNFIITSAVLLASADFITNLHNSWPKMALKVLISLFLA